MPGKAQKPNQQRTGGREKAAEQVTEAKASFMALADACKPLGFVQRKPYVSMGTAALLGFTLSYLRPAATTLPFLSLIAEIMNISSRFLKK